MKISVVTVCYNSVDTIEETMLSVLNQTHPDVEYIIIDGGSTDGTVDIIQNYADRLAYWVSEPDKGIYDAMNKGITIATGDYINFINSGDKLFSPDVISEIVSYLSDRPDVLYGDMKLKSYFGEIRLSPKSLDLMDTRDPIFHPASFIKTCELRRRQYDTSYKIAGDYKFFYDLYNEGGDFKYIPFVIAVFDGAGVSGFNDRLRLEENYRIQSKKLTTLRKIFVYYKVVRSKIRNLFLNLFPGLAKRLKRKRMERY